MTITRRGMGIDKIVDNLTPDETAYLQSRLWDNTELQEGGCWEWGGATTGGYGNISVDGEAVKTHRLSVYFKEQSDISNKMVNHHCDNKKCVRPSHLYLGTAKENAEDNIERGNINFATKYSDDTIDKIREALNAGVTQKEISEEYGASQSYISKIKNGKTKR